MLALQGHRMRLGPIVLAAGLQPGFNIPNVFILDLALGLLVVRGASSPSAQAPRTSQWPRSGCGRLPLRNRSVYRDGNRMVSDVS